MSNAFRFCVFAAAFFLIGFAAAAKFGGYW
jgi:hypothetical protein